MHRLQELVRLHRMGTGARKVAQLLVMSPNTEMAYRQALSSAGVLDGPADALPELAVLREAVAVHLPPKDKPQHESSITKWTELIEKMLDDGAAPTAIYDCLRLQNKEFEGSLSAVKRLCRRLRLAKGIEADDVAIPVETDAGEIAQVDFGSVGKLWDPETGRMREAYVFVLVLGYSRHMDPRGRRARRPVRSRQRGPHALHRSHPSPAAQGRAGAAGRATSSPASPTGCPRP